VSGPPHASVVQKLRKITAGFLADHTYGITRKFLRDFALAPPLKIPTRL
jgi:hypothetical protein